MTEFAVGSQVSWIEHFKHEKFFFSNAMEKVLLHSGDGFSCVIPTHVLLPSSKLVQNIVPRGEQDLEIILPSVSGSTLCTIVELLRCGISIIKGGIGSITVESIKEVQGVMELLRIEGAVSVTKNLMAGQMQTGVGYGEMEETDTGTRQMVLEADHGEEEVTDIGSKEMQLGEDHGEVEETDI